MQRYRIIVVLVVLVAAAAAAAILVQREDAGIARVGPGQRDLGAPRLRREARGLRRRPRHPVRARIGAVHSVVFGGFSSDSLADRILDADARVVITQDGSWRGGGVVPLKENTDVALERCPDVASVVVVAVVP